MDATESPSAEPPPTEQKIDPVAVELLAHTLFRTIFRDGVRVPLRVEGLVDLEVAVRDNNILVNVGQVQAELPPLAVWRITVAYQGHPVLDYGRGIRNDAKVHVPRLCFLLLTTWAQRRKRYRARVGGRPAPERTAIDPRDARSRPAGEPPAG
jgi:hypothetical protein